MLLQDQKRFTILEVAADWHELMIPQRTMRPSIARANEQLDPRFAASKHTTAPISHTRPSPRSPCGVCGVTSSLLVRKIIAKD